MTGAELRALRISLKLTQSELGEKLGITPSAVAHLESGKNTMGKQTEKLLSLLESEYI